MDESNEVVDVARSFAAITVTVYDEDTARRPTAASARGRVLVALLPVGSAPPPARPGESARRIDRADDGFSTLDVPRRRGPVVDTGDPIQEPDTEDRLAAAAHDRLQNLQIVDQDVSEDFRSSTVTLN
jgi:hypothetical protein